MTRALPAAWLLLCCMVALFGLSVPATALAADATTSAAAAAEHGDAAASAAAATTSHAAADGEETLADGSHKPDPIEEFAMNRFGPELKVGPIDMSITKPVLYLWLTAFICCGWGVWMSRRLHLRPNRKQTFTEGIYEFAHDQIAKATLGPKVYARYMPYVASLFIFLWVLNIISFIPLPVGHAMVQIGPFEVPEFQLYAAASNLNVTLALTLVTFVASHYEGIKHNGPKKYFGSWAPPGHWALQAFIWPLHALSELLRLVSLSVRLFANMLAGHLLIAMMLSLIIIIGSVWIAIGAVPIALFFFLFEFGLVASLQAFIFAMLSGIYIGFAAEPAH